MLQSLPNVSYKFPESICGNGMYITIAGKDTSGNPNSVTVMAENLNIGEMVRGIKEQSDDTKIE